MKKKHLTEMAFAVTMVGFACTAQAANVIVDGTFENTTELTYASTYNGEVGSWLTDGTWSLQMTDGYDDGLHFAQAGEGETGTSLYQVIQYQGDAGSISYNFVLKLPLLTFQIYGSDSQPAIGASWGDNAWGNRLISTTWSGAVDGWLPWGEGVTQPQQGYQWYTVRFLANQLSAVDSVRVDVPSVPLPGAVWLLGSGLAGLVTAARKKILFE